MRKLLPGARKRLTPCSEVPSESVPPKIRPGGVQPSGGEGVHLAVAVPVSESVSYSALPVVSSNPGMMSLLKPSCASGKSEAPSLAGLSQLGPPKGKSITVLKNVPAGLQRSSPLHGSPELYTEDNAVDLESSPNVAVKNRFSVLSSFLRDIPPNTEAVPVGVGSVPPSPAGGSADPSINPVGSGTPGRSSTVPGAAGPRPPPLYVQNFDEDLLKLSKSLEENYGKDFNLKFLGNRVRIQVYKVDDFNDLKSRLLTGNLAFHTFTMNSRKVLTVVLKGLSRVPSEEILSEIKSHGLVPISCVPLNPGSKKNSLYSSYKVVFPQGTSLNAVNKIGHIFHIRIYWEKFLSQRPFTQCYRCQSFGHSSANCNHPPKCVKCAGLHHSRECKKSIEVTPTCANCAGSHTANYSKCPSLERYLQARNRQVLAPVVPPLNDLNNNNNRPSLHSDFSGLPPSTRVLGYKSSYRDALLGNPGGSVRFGESGPPRHAPDDSAPVLETLSICREIGKICDLAQIQDAANRLLMKLRSCTTKGQQLAAFQEVAQFLD